jgi:predicted acylesterase/phospholipase RssA/CRP-like cAMP-binding protein
VDRTRLARLPLLHALPAPARDEIAAALSPVDLRVGERLAEPGGACDALHLVVDGQIEARAGGRVVARLGRGEVAAESGLYTGGAREYSLEATRATSVLRLPAEDWLRLLERHPREALRLAGPLFAGAPYEPATRGVALVPLGRGVAIRGLADDLVRALPRPATAIRRETVAVGTEALRGGDLALHEGLLATPGLHVFEADPAPTAWTEACVRQADVVLLVADARGEPAPFALPAPTRAPIDLVLLHPDRAAPPGDTGRWLDAHPVRQHHHVGGPADVARLARGLTGNAVQLVLGGGGARGLAHLGILRALRDAGVPVDFVGGTSIGAILSALCAMERSVEEILEQIRRFARTRRAPTLPLHSFFSDRSISNALVELCGGVAIEDLWLPWFGVSADLRTGEEVLHTRGPLWRALRASASLPGAWPPVIEGARCLVDGGVLNNLPVDVMAARGAGRILAVDCADGGFPAVDAAPPWWLRPFAPWRRRGTPHLGRLLLRSGGISTQRITRHVVERHPAVLHVRPPVREFGALDFASADAIVEAGWRFATEHVEAWKERLSAD